MSYFSLECMKKGKFSSFLLGNDPEIYEEITRESFLGAVRRGLCKRMLYTDTNFLGSIAIIILSGYWVFFSLFFLFYGLSIPKSSFPIIKETESDSVAELWNTSLMAAAFISCCAIYLINFSRR